MKKKMIVNGVEVSTRNKGNALYISLTDIARLKNIEDPSDVIKKWMSNRDSFDFYGLWEELFNPDFNSAEFSRIKVKESGYNAFTMSPTQWKKRVNAIGIIPGAGKYSEGTFAHPDIAMEFASWIDTSFKLYLIKEFQRLKVKEREQLEWDAKRELSKINYRIQTDAIKTNLIVPTLTPKQINFVYASEGDRLNVCLFGKTAAEWREENPDQKGNVRDYANIQQLLVIANMESYNAAMINEGIKPEERTKKLNDMARHQMHVLLQSSSKLLLENK